jgi:hypothetical protein
LKSFSQKLAYHLNSDAENSLKVELATALLEEILKGLAKKVHDHNMISLVILGFLVTDEMQVGHTGYRYISDLFR